MGVTEQVAQGTIERVKAGRPRRMLLKEKEIFLSRMSVGCENFQSTPGIEPGTSVYVGKHSTRTPPPLPMS